MSKDKGARSKVKRERGKKQGARSKEKGERIREKGEMTIEQRAVWDGSLQCIVFGTGFYKTTQDGIRLP